MKKKEGCLVWLVVYLPINRNTFRGDQDGIEDIILITNVTSCKNWELCEKHKLFDTDFMARPQIIQFKNNNVRDGR